MESILYYDEQGNHEIGPVELGNVSHWATFQVITIQPTTSVARARELLEFHQIHHLPVLQRDQVVGIVTDRDLSDVFPSAGDYARSRAALKLLERTSVKRIMTPTVVFVNSATSLSTAATIMTEMRTRAVVVRLREGFGIMTRTDILRALASIRESKELEAPKERPMPQLQTKRALTPFHAVESFVA